MYFAVFCNVSHKSLSKVATIYRPESNHRPFRPKTLSQSYHNSRVASKSNYKDDYESEERGDL